MAPLLPWYVPDEIYPSNNAFGIPMLDPAMQANGIVGNLKGWSKYSRRKQHPGTFHFYTKDNRFTALLKHPEAILLSRCQCIIEPNFSTSSMMPRPIALYGIYWKRWLARFCQTRKIFVIVDLNMNEKFADDNLLGVPDGWAAFATRVHRGQEERVFQHWEQAKAKALGKHPLFVVYGGRAAIAEHAQSLGWIHVPEDRPV
jgi:hypothetical protein